MLSLNKTICIAVSLAFLQTACAKNENIQTGGNNNACSITVDNGFPIIAWTGIDSKDTGEKFPAMKQCGINTYLGWYKTLDEVMFALDNAEKAGVKLIIKSDELFSDTGTAVSRMKDHPALLCYHIKDEPETSDFPQLEGIVSKIQSLDANHPCYVNLYPNWAWGNIDSYMSKVVDFVTQVPVKFLSFDQYPVIEKNGTCSLRPGWYKNLEDIRQVSRARKMDFWAFALALSHKLDDILYPVPTVEELRLQMFSNLVYGAQAFQYFTYWGIYHNQPTSVYDKVKTVNEELQALAPVFLGASVENVWHVGAEIPYGTKPLVSMPEGVSSLSVSGIGAVVSYIIKDGLKYIAIVNRDYKSPMSLDISFRKDAYSVGKDGSKNLAGRGQVTVQPGDIVVYQLAK